MRDVFFRTLGISQTKEGSTQSKGYVVEAGVLLVAGVQEIYANEKKVNQ